MAKKIIFRADGNASTGLGHLYRLFSLVEMVKTDLEFVFLTKEDSTLEVIPKDYKILTIPQNIAIDQEPEWLKTHFSPEDFVIIADGYHFNSAYQRQLKHIEFKLIYIDDLAKEEMYADIVINHSPYLKASDYNKQPYTQLALGTSYALLRPAFLKAAQHKRNINNIDEAFVCFGGADPFNLTTKAVEALHSKNKIKKVHVVLGGAYKHKEIYELAKKHTDRVLIYKNLSEDELASVMKGCNFAIAPASTILYELSCIKMPILSGFYVDNQELIYKGFLSKNAIYEGRDMTNYKTTDFSNKIEAVLDIDSHQHILESQSLLFDGEIKSRHLNLINQIC